MKSCLVTGANSEIGTSICKFLLEKNYEVIACYHNNSDRISAIKSANLILKKVELCSEDEIKELLNGSIFDLIINAAAYYFDDEIGNTSKETFMKTLEVNVVAPFLISKYAVMNNGIVINISSRDGIDTFNELNIPYSVSKAGLNLLTKNLDYAVKGVKFYALSLEWLDTETIHEINQDYLKSEMERCNQKELIPLDKVNKYIDKILKGEFKSGEIIKVDDKNEC